MVKTSESQFEEWFEMQFPEEVSESIEWLKKNEETTRWAHESALAKLLAAERRELQRTAALYAWQVKQ